MEYMYALFLEPLKVLFVNCEKRVTMVALALVLDQNKFLKLEYVVIHLVFCSRIQILSFQCCLQNAKSGDRLFEFYDNVRGCG